MADGRLRELERVYFEAPSTDTLLHLLEHRIRYGLELEPDRVRALVTKPAVRCFAHTVETTGGPYGANHILEIPAFEFHPCPFPKLGGEYEFFIPLSGDYAHPFRGYTIDLVTFNAADTGVLLSSKPIGMPILLNASFELRFIFRFGDWHSQEATLVIDWQNNLEETP